MRLINLTPHTLRIHLTSDTDGDVIEIAPSGAIARASEMPSTVELLNCDSLQLLVPVARFTGPRFGRFEIAGDAGDEDLNHPGAALILSAIALEAVKIEQPELARRCYAPGPAIRRDGVIVGCSGLVA